jgi:hypothetical protein
VLPFDRLFNRLAFIPLLLAKVEAKRFEKSQQFIGRILRFSLQKINQ